MYAALLTGAIALTTLIDSDGWRYTGAIQGELNGQSETIQLLYAPPLFALAIPETEATPAGLLVISEFDLSPLGFFGHAFGPFHFTSVVGETVHPETGFFHASLWSEYEGSEALFGLAPISGDTGAISYRGKTILLPAGDYVLTVPAPRTFLLAAVALGGLFVIRRGARG